MYAFSFSCPDEPLTITRISPHKPGSLRRRFSLIANLSTELEYVPPEPIEGRKTLVLDLDETLIHSSEFPPHSNVDFFKVKSSSDFNYQIILPNSQENNERLQSIYVYKRPGLDEFLKYASKNFELFIYTYAERHYAEPILNIILPFLDEDHRLYRDSCIKKKGKHAFKDLKMLNRKKTDLIFVDDNDEAHKQHPKNTIVIPTWNGMPSDKVLSKWLTPLLQRCNDADDVRDVIKSLPNQKSRYSLY